MRVRENSALVILMLVILFVGGCGKIPKHSFNEKKSLIESISEQEEINIFKEVVRVSTYASKGAVSKLHKIGCGEIFEVILLSSEHGSSVAVTDVVGQKYYVGLGSLGYVEVIREESENGTLLYVAMDD